MMEAFVLRLCQEIPSTTWAEIHGIQDTRLWCIVAHYVEKEQRESPSAGVRRILIEKTSAAEATAT